MDCITMEQVKLEEFQVRQDKILCLLFNPNN